MYTCGPTVYDFAHIGNLRAYVFEDLLRRTLKYRGYGIRQVMNLTDVDDKTICNSMQAGTSLRDFTQQYKDAFFQDLDTLNIERAEVYPEATEHVSQMIELVETLVEKGYAYATDDGCVYFSIAQYQEYGKLSGVDTSELQHGARVKHDEYAKESVADFALWKAWEKSDGDVWWNSPWGPGRPGWHVECSAMSMEYLGKTFDIHTGGMDNVFPHHEDEIAQSEAANECRFVNYWLHCSHLIVEGKKMSKSLGNFYTLRDLLAAGYSGREVRWVLMGTHYRQQLNFTFQGLQDARSALQRIDDFVLRLQENAAEEVAMTDEVKAEIERAEQAFCSALEDDLNISRAIGVLFDLVREMNRIMDNAEIGQAVRKRTLDTLRTFDKVLGCLHIDGEQQIPQEVQRLVEERQEARKNKDFQTADSIRDQMAAQGWIVEDTPSGPRVKPQ